MKPAHRPRVARYTRAVEGEREHIDGFGPTAPHASGDAPTDAATGTARRPEEPDSLLGEVLVERYRIDHRLGSGGMGAVYAGTHLLLGKPVAIKLIKPRFGDDRGIAQRFVQEARAASGIDHPNVVHITDFGETPDGTAFLVMDLLAGEDLAETLNRDGPLPWQRVAHIGEQIARALAAAHKRGIVHRDIKPANCCRLTRDEDPDFVVVLDFGLAKVVGPARSGDRSLTQTGALLGTPGYIAPELYRGLEADHRVDLYALGALMYKLLTGELPPMRFGVDDPSGVKLLPAPLALQAIVRRALAEDPSERYATAQALAADLRAVVINPEAAPLFQAASSGPRHDSPTGVRLDVREPSAPSSSKLVAVTRQGHRVYVSVGAPLLVLLIVAAGIGVYSLLRPEETTPAEPTPPVEAAAGDSTNPTARPVTPGRRAQTAEVDEPRAVFGAGRPRPPDASTGEAATTGADEPATSGEPAPEDSQTATTEATPDPPPEATPEAAPAKPAPEPAARPRPGSPEALQRAIYRACPSTFVYTFEVAWKTDAKGRVLRDSVNPPDSQNASQSCALGVIKRNTMIWSPGRTYREKFKVGEPKRSTDAPPP